ncbi:MAG TPA: hypothetical protein VGE77_01570 [Nocardioides sp.]
MFVHRCSSCEKRQLIFDTQFTAVRAVDGGWVATFTCWCGATQEHVNDGARAAMTLAA